MKIGDFAGQYGLSIDTVRYYIKIGLLHPERVGIRHRFDESCHRNMQKIQDYKSLGFSLLEIQRLFSVHSLYNGTYRIQRDSLLDLLREKSRLAELRIREERRALNNLKKQIKAMETEEFPLREVFLPLSALNLLACPRCGKGFTAQCQGQGATEIRNDLVCSCGCRIGVHRNILTLQQPGGIAQQAPKEFILQFIRGGEGQELVHGLDTMIYQESRRLSQGTGNILCLQNLPVIPYYKAKRDGYYILVSDNRDYLNMVYESLSLIGGLEQFILMECSIDQIPLKRGTVQSIYDFFYSDMASLIHGNRYLERLAPLMCNEGDYLHIGLSLASGGAMKNRDFSDLSRFSEPLIAAEFERNNLLLQESSIIAEAPLEKLLSQETKDLVKTLGLELNWQGPAQMRSQLFRK